MRTNPRCCSENGTWVYEPTLQHLFETESSCSSHATLHTLPYCIEPFLCHTYLGIVRFAGALIGRIVEPAFLCGTPVQLVCDCYAVNADTKLGLEIPQSFDLCVHTLEVDKPSRLVLIEPLKLKDTGISQFPGHDKYTIPTYRSKRVDATH